MGYQKPFIPPKVTATWNILNDTRMYWTLHRSSIEVYHHLCIQFKLKKEPQPNRPIMVPLDGLFGLRDHHNYNSVSSEYGSQTASGQAIWSAIHIIRGMGMVTHLQSSNFQVLRRFIAILHSMWPTTVGNQLPAQSNNSQVMGPRGKDMTPTMVVVASLECSPRSSN